MELNDLKWTDVRDFGVLGKGWTDTESFFHRFPARAKGVIRDDVWKRSTAPSGLRVHFTTDSSVLAADWSLLSGAIMDEKNPPVGASGLDLYVRHDRRWQWCAMAADRPRPSRKFLFTEMLPGPHEYMLYLPLLNDTESLSIGIAPDASLTHPAPQPGNPILFYGTSIVHGGCASRPGMAYPAILSRRLDRPFINLGFCGQGRMDPEVARLLAELDPVLYVVDPLPNLQPNEVAQRTEPFIRILRDARPTTPIVLVEGFLEYNSPFLAPRRNCAAGNNREFKAAYRRLLDAHVTGLHYVSGDNLIGVDGEATVDGVHPTDLGFMRMADVLEPVLRDLL
jgi:hypothetical protein